MRRCLEKWWRVLAAWDALLEDRSKNLIMNFGLFEDSSEDVEENIEKMKSESYNNNISTRSTHIIRFIMEFKQATISYDKFRDAFVAIADPCTRRPTRCALFKDVYAEWKGLSKLTDRNRLINYYEGLVVKKATKTSITGRLCIPEIHRSINPGDTTIDPA